MGGSECDSFVSWCEIEYRLGTIFIKPFLVLISAIVATWAQSWFACLALLPPIFCLYAIAIRIAVKEKAVPILFVYIPLLAIPVGFVAMFFIMLLFILIFLFNEVMAFLILVQSMIVITIEGAVHVQHLYHEQREFRHAVAAVVHAATPATLVVGAATEAGAAISTLQSGKLGNGHQSAEAGPKGNTSGDA